MINQKQKEFIKLLEQASWHRPIMDVFSDFCAVISCACEQISRHADEREKRYNETIAHYDAEERQLFVKMFALLVEALEERRESFLGPVLEEIGAANTRNGQFLTPVDLAKLMGRITSEKARENHKEGEIVTIADPACGAGVLVIQGAEEMVESGIPRRDIMIVAGDVDRRACDITFSELTLLGYAARIEHKNAITQTVLTNPRWTIGYYLNGTQWREGRQKI